MKLSPLFSSLLLVSGVSVAACSSSTADEEVVESSEAALRAMNPNEILGQIEYADTKEVDLTTSPKYRAFWFNAERGDQIQAQVIARDATDTVLWLTDENFNVLSMSQDTRPTDTNSNINGRFLPKTGKYWLVFREMNFAPRAKFSVSLRKLGNLPLDCDPDGEGIWSPDCTDPPEFDPFDPAVCSGAGVTAQDAAAKFGAGINLSVGKIFYRTRQCSVANDPQQPECSDWVRAFSMDIPLAKIAPTQGAPNTWTITGSSTSRPKVKIDFTADATGPALKNFCVDGPFANLRGQDWSMFTDGTPGVCGSQTASTVITGNCARIDTKSIQLNSGNPDYYTEFSALLWTRY